MSGFWMEGKGIVLFLIVVSEVILVLSSDWRIKSERHRKQIGSFFGQFIDIGVYLVLPPIDHLGNAQLTFADLDKDGNITVNHTNPLETEIIQENHYYPFGMQHEQPTTQIDIANDYTYNGKELNDDFDLNLHDYGARWYDASLGRFHTTDRFQEKYVDLTPYQYGGNNPILFIDINGDSLDVGGPSLQESFKDVQESMLDKKDQERLTYDKETGSVSLNLDGVKYNKKNKIKTENYVF